MKKIIFRIWAINLLTSIILLVIFRLSGFLKDYSAEMSFFDKVNYVLGAFVNLYLSALFCVIMFFCSLLIFLNLIAKFRNNFLLSFLSFLGIPLFMLIYMVYIIMADLSSAFSTEVIKFFGNVWLLIIMYNLKTLIEFLWFRKKMKTLKLDS